MAQSELECVNGALAKIGSSRLANLNGTDDKTVTLVERLPICKKTLLRTHPWNFSVKRKLLRPFQPFAISNVTFVSSELLEVTHATMASGDALVAGYYVTIYGVTGAREANGTWEVASVPGTTTTRVTAPGVTSLTTYTAGSDFIRRSPAFEYSYLYNLPSDCLRVWKIDEQTISPRWKIEGRFILSDIDDQLEIRYVFDETDYTKFDTGFYDLLQLFLAHDVCYRFTQSSTLKDQLAQELKQSMPKVRFDDASEEPADPIQADDWVAAREYSSDSWFNVGRL